MRIMRRFILPTATASLAITLVLLPLLGGRSYTLSPSDAQEFSFNLGLVGLFVFVGLLVVGLPLAKALCRHRIRLTKSILILLTAGSIGGTVIIMIFLFLFYLGGGDFQALVWVSAILGAPAGVLTAAIWSLMNRDMLASQASERGP